MTSYTAQVDDQGDRAGRRIQQPDAVSIGWSRLGGPEGRTRDLPMSSR